MKDIISEFIGLVKTEQARIAESLTAGHVINFESYQRLVGNHQGLQTSLDILNTIMTQDDEDQQ
jgi:hypothetical protein